LWKQCIGEFGERDEDIVPSSCIRCIENGDLKVVCCRRDDASLRGNSGPLVASAGTKHDDCNSWHWNTRPLRRARLNPSLSTLFWTLIVGSIALLDMFACHRERSLGSREIEIYAGIESCNKARLWIMSCSDGPDIKLRSNTYAMIRTMHCLLLVLLLRLE
jgi:hypothetical protein